MPNRSANKDIGCKVHSCAFHCGSEENCSLRSIMVEPRVGCGSGEKKDESMCASYVSK
ncbi:MAG: DUF1540 domain-containing protein [Clostridiales bacterium]|nr:DUF1540 domain-containing protein [Clostridiales bacterium]